MGSMGINFGEEGKLPNKSKDENNRIAKAVTEILLNNELEDLTKYEIVSNYVRKWTSIRTVNGAYRGVPYFTPDAYKKYQELWEEHEHNLTEFSSVLGQYFTHEHILPVSAAGRLFDVKNEVTEEWVRWILFTELNAAVVTKDEADLLDKGLFKDKMPDSFYNTANIFERYIAVGITLLYVRWNEDTTEIEGEPQKVNMEEGVLSNHFKHHFEYPSESYNKRKDKGELEPGETEPFTVVFPQLEDKHREVMEKLAEKFTQVYGGPFKLEAAKKTVKNQPKSSKKKKK